MTSKLGVSSSNCWGVVQLEDTSGDLAFTTVISYSLSRKLRVGFGMTRTNFLAAWPSTWVVSQLEGFLFFFAVMKLFCTAPCFFCFPQNQQISGYNFKNSMKYKSE